MHPPPPLVRRLKSWLYRPQHNKNSLLRQRTRRLAATIPIQSWLVPYRWKFFVDVPRKDRNIVPGMPAGIVICRHRRIERKFWKSIKISWNRVPSRTTTSQNSQPAGNVERLLGKKSTRHCPPTNFMLTSCVTRFLFRLRWNGGLSVKSLAPTKQASATRWSWCCCFCGFFWICSLLQLFM